MSSSPARAIAVCLFACSLIPAQTQHVNKPVLYTYASSWVIPRAMWADYAKGAKADDAMLAKAVPTAEPESTGPVLAAAKHWDYVMESHDYNAHSGTFTNGYFRLASWNYKPRAGDPGMKLMRATVEPVLDKLLESSQAAITGLLDPHGHRDVLARVDAMTCR